MKCYHRRQTTRWGVTERSPTMVTLHDTRFVKCRWWNDGWSVKTVITWRSSVSMIPAPGLQLSDRHFITRPPRSLSECPTHLWCGVIELYLHVAISGLVRSCTASLLKSKLTYMSVYIHTCVHTHACIHVRTYSHTHTHTPQTPLEQPLATLPQAIPPAKPTHLKTQRWLLAILLLIGKLPRRPPPVLLFLPLLISSLPSWVGRSVGGMGWGLREGGGGGWTEGGHHLQA